MAWLLTRSSQMRFVSPHRSKPSGSGNGYISSFNECLIRERENHTFMPHARLMMRLYLLRVINLLIMLTRIIVTERFEHIKETHIVVCSWVSSCPKFPLLYLDNGWRAAGAVPPQQCSKLACHCLCGTAWLCGADIIPPPMSLSGQKGVGQRKYWKIQQLQVYVGLGKERYVAGSYQPHVE